MSVVIERTMDDLRRGRHSWRVSVMLFVPAFAVGIGTAVLSMGA